MGSARNWWSQILDNGLLTTTYVVLLVLAGLSGQLSGPEASKQEIYFMIWYWSVEVASSLSFADDLTILSDTVCFMEVLYWARLMPQRTLPEHLFRLPWVE